MTADEAEREALGIVNGTLGLSWTKLHKAIADAILAAYQRGRADQRDHDRKYRRMVLLDPDKTLLDKYDEDMRKEQP